MDNAMVDLEEFDWEYAELIGCAARLELQEIELAFICPIEGWATRGWLQRLGRRLHLPISERPLAYLVTMQFKGVTDIVDELGPWLEERAITLSTHSHVEVESIDTVELERRRYRLYLRCEDQRLEFTYQSCALRQQPVDLPPAESANVAV